ncbi:CLUMA_CG000456, isoform A [Clunio marinus]|uniref:CLUMA_CG000456, isoform A n=1 Tax=Clunio marinus TaxID=568069 RepID=A0A1J1HFJ3_9DIPT|nr:CLUMA_CG000456, isoform A [Clunio marinus]
MVNVRPLNDELQKKAIKELNEDPERIPKDLETFREWIKKSPHIKCFDDDQFLINFLRGCKFSMERVKQKFDLYHTLKTHIPELTRNRDPLDEKVLGAIRQAVGIPLPHTDGPDGPRYFLVRPGNYNPSEYSITDIIKVSTMINDLMMLEDDNFVIAGSIGILDFTGTSMSHFLQFNPTFIKQMTMIQQDANPIRQKGSHFVNMPSIALTVFNIFQSFTNEKNKKRVFVHGHDMESLYKSIPRKLLPKEYGGEAGTIEEIAKDVEKRLIARRDFFLEDEKFGVDEKKRVGRPKNPESLFGIEGSFRQLAID